MTELEKQAEAFGKQLREFVGGNVWDFAGGDTTEGLRLAWRELFEAIGEQTGVQALDDVWHEGQSHGFDEGHGEGYSTGYAEGLSDGTDAGYQDGWEAAGGDE